MFKLGYVMKNIFLFLLFVYCSIIFGQVQQVCQSDDQNLVIVIMVKNEQDVMQKTLQPFIDAHVKNYVILDTGSTDKTVQVTRDLFQKHNISCGYVIEQPFVDFATSRNYALRQAEKYFPKAIFFLMIDAEWYAHGVPDLVAFCKDHATSAEKSYGLLINSCRSLQFYMPRLFKAHQGLEFIGSVHEYLNDSSDIFLPDTIFVNYDPCQKGLQKSIDRGVKDCEWLLKDHKKNPKDGRTVYLLASTYQTRGDTRKALMWYKKKCDLNYKDDLEFLSYVNMGKIYQKQRKWNKAIECYTKAFSIEPSRAEPLIKMAQLYWERKNYALSYMFALNAFNMPSPATGTLFVDTHLYDYVNYDLIGRIAWRMGDCDFGKCVTLAALEKHPGDAQLTKNLQHYS